MEIQLHVMIPKVTDFRITRERGEVNRGLNSSEAYLQTAYMR